MGLFDSLAISGSGVGVYRKWLDALNDNIANVNTVRRTSQPAFQERFVVADAVEGPAGTGMGSQVNRIEYGDAAGRLVYAPSHPLADADGMVRQPNLDLADQMTSLIMAQRGYEANLAVVDRAKEAYTAALQLGRSS